MNYEDEFKKLGLPSETPERYQGANHFARHFSRTTILKNQQVRYSVRSPQSSERKHDFWERHLKAL